MRSVASVVSCAVLLACGTTHEAVTARPPSEPRAPGRDLLVRAEALVVSLEGGDAAPAPCEYAAATLSHLAEEVPGRAVDAIELHARALVACGRGPEALAALRRALALDGWHAGALTLAARLVRYEGRLDEAERLVRRALDGERSGRLLPKAEVDALLELAAVLRDRSTSAALDEAEGVLQRAISRQPDRIAAYNGLAQVYLAQAEWNPHRLEAATATCRRAVEIDESYAPIHTTWGQIDLRKGFAVSASARFERAIELDRVSLEPRLAFGSLAVLLGAYEEARRALEEAVGLDERALREARPGMFYDAHVYLGVALRGLRRDPDARAAWQRARAIDPERPEAYYELGRLAAASRDPTAREEARDNLEAFLARAGRRDESTGAVEEARRLLRRIGP